MSKLEGYPTLKEVVNEHFRASYIKCGYNKKLLARVLDVSYKTVGTHFREHGLKYNTGGENLVKTNINTSGILTVKELIKEYIIECYALCGYNKSMLARTLDISHRTVNSHLTAFEVETVIFKQDTKLAKISKDENSLYDCMRPVTQDQRDKWYNKDFY